MDLHGPWNFRPMRCKCNTPSLKQDVRRTEASGGSQQRRLYGLLWQLMAMASCHVDLTV